MARDFNGSNQRAEGDWVGLNVPLTMAIWFNPANASVTHVLFQLGVAGASDQGRFTLNAHGALVGDPLRCSTVNSVGTSSFASTTTGFVAGTWQHACAVFSSSSSRAVYLNGSGKGTNSESRAINTPTKVNIGSSQSTTGNYPSHAKAALALPTIWEVALTDAEIALLAKPGFNPLHMRPEHIVWHSPLIGRFSPEIEIYGGNNLTLANSPPSADNPRQQEVVLF